MRVFLSIFERIVHFRVAGVLEFYLNCKRRLNLESGWMSMSSSDADHDAVI